MVCRWPALPMRGRFSRADHKPSPAPVQSAELGLRTARLSRRQVCTKQSVRREAPALHTSGLHGQVGHGPLGADDVDGLALVLALVVQRDS